MVSSSTSGPLRPILATAGPAPSEAAGWAVEFKWDGIRALVTATPGGVGVSSRNGNDITRGYPELTGLNGLGRSVTVDGELVALDRGGRPDFGLLQQRMHVRDPSPELTARVPVVLYVFDLLDLDGHRLVDDTYDGRRDRLLTLGLDRVAGVEVPPSFIDVTGAALLDIARAHGLEGVVAKRRTSRYAPGRRSAQWVKTALLTTQEVVIGGWTAGQGRRASTVGALLLGAHDPAGRLRHLGNVGTGFTDAMLRDLHTRLLPLEQPTSPFGEPVPREYTRGARWVTPRLVGEVQYRTLTADSRLRHAAWRRLRPDRDPHEIQIDLR